MITHLRMEESAASPMMMTMRILIQGRWGDKFDNLRGKGKEKLKPFTLEIVSRFLSFQNLVQICEGIRFSVYIQSSLSGHSRKRTALFTATLTKPRVNSSSYKLCIYTFPQAASASCGHFFCFPWVFEYRCFDCSKFYYYRITQYRTILNVFVRVFHKGVFFLA